MASHICNRSRLLLLGLAAACWATAATAQPIVLRGPGEGQVRALLIGIDAYRHVRPLKGAVSDARDIEGSLRRTGVADLTTLVDAAADRDSVLRQIDALLGRTASSDVHGGRLAHEALPGSSPSATGTPTSEPYSVQDPS